jgi:hypothetical protein
MRRWRLLVATIASAVALLAIWAPAASATFHLMQIREVYPGSVADPGSEYVELQMWAEGQNHVEGHVLRSYDATGAVTGTDTFPADVVHGADQSTMVLATPEAEAQFGLVADAPLAPSGQLDPSGGAVCWENLDCVSWGTFSGSPPSPAGSPAAPGGIPDGMALRRSIAPGCATLLEPGDDHDNSAADFSAVFPGPRPNSVPPSEHACGTGGGGNGAGGPSQPVGGPPQTTLGRIPAKRSRDRTPTFRFAATDASAGFECSLDAHLFRACRSPFTAKRLALGHHVFKVRASDQEGADPSPASYAFKVLRKGPSGR